MNSGICKAWPRSWQPSSAQGRSSSANMQVVSSWTLTSCFSSGSSRRGTCERANCAW
ncbi:unnamed protein product [Symbiodinium natans]|uniref:Uncharacterized protein n=1 Tax=Symbiodinium natans TaxID=878477 RepID=A0A812RKH7_9DINO|nr:unnamed protein product [Symbiodinium natans]